VTVTARGVLVRGHVWPGDGPAYDGWLAVGADGLIAATGLGEPEPVSDLPLLGGSGCWVLPGIVDAHVHLVFGDFAGEDDVLAGGVVAVRDLGAPPADAWRWRASAGLVVAAAGPLLTAPGGYPSSTWGADGFAQFVPDAAAATTAVAELVAAGADLIKLALEPAGDQLVVSLETARAIVGAAHAHGLAVTCHALRTRMVERALDAGVDELCHTPVEPLPAALVERITAAGIPVVSTLQTFVDSNTGEAAVANARALHTAGVPLVYGTDLGNAGTRPGVEPRELAQLVAAGMTPTEALRSATRGDVAGLRGRVSGSLRVGEPARLLVVDWDPLADFAYLRQPLAVVVGTRLTLSLTDAQAD
jgi:imidazolonepropionase-like amidohydrolase